MMDMYSAVLSVQKATIFVEQIFKKFDSDLNGSIDFKVRSKRGSSTIVSLQSMGHGWVQGH